MSSKLRHLARNILRCVEVLENDCSSRRINVPDIDRPFVAPTSINESHDNNNDFNRSSKQVAEAVNAIVASAMLLVQSVQSPVQSVRIAATSVSAPNASLSFHRLLEDKADIELLMV